MEDVKNKLQAELDSIQAKEDALQAEADANLAAKIAAGEYNTVIELTIGLLGQVEKKWKDIAAAAKKAATGLAGGELPGGDEKDSEDNEFIDENTKKITDQIKALTDLREQTESGTAINFKLKEQIDELKDNLKYGTSTDSVYDERDRIRARMGLPRLGSAKPSVNGGGGGRFGMLYESKGGLIKPQYMAMGGLARGADKIPAMLSPGEFVVSRYAVDNYGVDRLKAINSGQYDGSSVYNYSVNVNVDGSSSDAKDIARAVIKQIQQLDGQRVRRQAV